MEKILESDILEAIQEKFGTLAAYAEFKQTSPQNISDKIRRQSSKFMKQLKDDGINIKSIHQSNGEIQIAGVNGSPIRINAGEAAREIETLQTENKSLKRENELLQEALKGKDAQIALLNELLTKERNR